MGRNKTAIENMKVGKLVYGAGDMCEIEIPNDGNPFILRFGRMVQPSRGRGRPAYGYSVCAVVNGEVRTIPGEPGVTKDRTVGEFISNAINEGVLA